MSDKCWRVELPASSAAVIGLSTARTTDVNKDGNVPVTLQNAEDSNSKQLLLSNTVDPDYKKDYEAVLQIKQQLEARKNLMTGRRLQLTFSLDWMFARKPPEYGLLAFVAFLFLLIVAGLIVIYQLHVDDVHYIYQGQSIEVNEKTLDIQIYKHSREDVVVAGRLWMSRPSGMLPYECSVASDVSLCLAWKRTQQLNIDTYTLRESTCHKFSWISLDSHATFMDCFELGDAHWYGAGLVSGSMYPLEKACFERQPFVTGSRHSGDSAFGPVIEGYWLSSKGFAIHVDRNVTLDISMNAIVGNATDGRLCLYSDKKSASRVRSQLSYTVCVAADVRQVHRTVAPLFSDPRAYTQIPQAMLFYPVWSTWSVFKKSINQQVLTDFATNITFLQLAHGLLLIDDGWEDRYGDMQFDSRNFPNPQKMVAELHSMKFQVSLQFNTQINTDTESFRQASDRDFLIRDLSASVPGLTRWWNGPQSDIFCRGIAGIVDLSDATATDWFRNRLHTFMDNNSLQSLHFSGGDISSLPIHSVFRHPFSNPNEFTFQACQLAASCSVEGRPAVVHSAFKCQSLPLIVRITGGFSRWDSISGGLRAVIPSALTLGLLGYPFFIQQEVGGSGYGEVPQKELYIRWLQLSAFLPILHFSIPPYTYDDDTVIIAKEVIALHNTVVVPAILNVLNTSQFELSPLIRPLWWIAPRDDYATESNSQFMVGNTLMVAPILDEGARMRDIYLPYGIWLDKLTGKTYVGKMWLYQYQVPLNRIPFFEYRPMSV